MSSNREELIERAKIAMAIADGQRPSLMDSHTLEVMYGAAARAALDVFEAAHAPTAPVTLSDEHDAAREEAKVQFPSSTSAQAAFIAGWAIRAVRGPAVKEGGQ